MKAREAEIRAHNDQGNHFGKAPKKSPEKPHGQVGPGVTGGSTENKGSEYD